MCFCWLFLVFPLLHYFSTSACLSPYHPLHFCLSLNLHFSKVVFLCNCLYISLKANVTLLVYVWNLSVCLFLFLPLNVYVCDICLFLYFCLCLHVCLFSYQNMAKRVTAPHPCQWHPPMAPYTALCMTIQVYKWWNDIIWYGGACCLINWAFVSHRICMASRAGISLPLRKLWNSGGYKISLPAAAQRTA